MRKRGSFMTARTISLIRTNGPAAMSPRIRAENRERERKRERTHLFADFSTCEYGGIGRGSRKHGDRVYGGSLAGWNASIFRKETVSPPPSFPESGGKTTRVQWRRDASVAQSNRNRTIHSRFRYSARPFAFNLRSVFLSPNLPRPIVLFILLVAFLEEWSWKESFDTCSQDFSTKQTILEERIVYFISNKKVIRTILNFYQLNFEFNMSDISI